VGGGSTAQTKWADGRRLPITKIVVITVALLSSYLSLPLSEIQERAEEIQFSNPNIPLDVLGVNSTLPRIETGPDGVLHAVWTDPRFGYKNIAYTRSHDNGTTWEPVINISRAWAGFYAMNPGIAIDRGGGPFDGTIYVVYEWIIPGDSRDIYTSLSRDGGNTWIENIRVDHALPDIDSARPCVTVNLDGVVFAAWYDRRVPESIYHIFGAKSTDGGMTWVGDYQISQSYLINLFPAIAAHPNGDLYVAWQEYNENETTSIIVARSQNGIDWDILTVATGVN